MQMAKKTLVKNLCPAGMLARAAQILLTGTECVVTEGSSGESHSGDDKVCGAAPRAETIRGEASSPEAPRADSAAGAAERGETQHGGSPRGEAKRSTVTRSAADEAKRQARIAAAKAAYLRTVRNEAGQSAGGSNDDRLLADRPPHWHQNPADDRLCLLLNQQGGVGSCFGAPVRWNLRFSRKYSRLPQGDSL